MVDGQAWFQNTIVYSMDSCSPRGSRCGEALRLGHEAQAVRWPSSPSIAVHVLTRLVHQVKRQNEHEAETWTMDRRLLPSCTVKYVINTGMVVWPRYSMKLDDRHEAS